MLVHAIECDLDDDCDCAVSVVELGELVVVELGCELDLPSCRALAERDFRGTFYSDTELPLSIANLEPWRVSRVTRENVNYSERAGYRHEIIDRADWEDDLYALRSSRRVRQGRPMPAAYLEPEAYASDPLPHEQPCPRHMDVVHGVVTSGEISNDELLVAYAHVVQCGDVARFNTILGHWDYLADRVVWLLVRRAIEWHIAIAGARFALYYAHDSGGDGLRYFKERLGFRPAHVDWRFA